MKRPHSLVVVAGCIGLALASCSPSANTNRPSITSPSTTPPSATVSNSGQFTCEDLDTLPVGMTIGIAGLNHSFQPPLMDIGAHPFTSIGGATTSNGLAHSENGGKAGGSGTEIHVQDLTLSISRGFGQVLQRVRISFGNYGGNLNVSVNNAAANVHDFAALQGTPLGGVAITVLSGGNGNNMGSVAFTGSMPDQANGLGQFAVGGQDLWIDDICFGV